MRALTVLFALMLVPVVVAEQGSEPSGADGGHEDGGNETANATHSPGPDRRAVAAACRDADDRRDCVREYCREHGGDACAQQRDACAGDCPALRKVCDRAADDRRVGVLCERLAEAEDLRAAARHVDFVLDREGRALRNYSVDGVVLLSAIEYSDDASGFEADRHGARIRFETNESRLEIHDTPTGQFWYRGDAELALVLPAGAEASEREAGIDIHVDGHRARLVGAGLVLDGDRIHVTGHASFSAPADGSARDQGVESARAAQKLGAEIDVAAGEDGVVAYDDVNITMAGDMSSGMRILMDAELDSGRSFVIDIERDMLTGPGLNLSYYDVHDDGSETQVVFLQASSMQDALDPDDDGGQPEYWVFEDEDGLHVMVSVPHWSAHAIDIQSVGEFLVQPSVVLGIAAGVVGVAVAGTAMFWPRRREI